MKSRIVALRHVERDKSNTADPQTPTPGGEITAYAMGVVLRKKFDFNFITRTTSPQPRGFRTDAIFAAGFCGFDRDPKTTLPEMTTDERLNDFSTDSRTMVKDTVAFAKPWAKKHGIEVEQAMFIAPECRETLDLKVSEMMQVINELSQIEGDHLMCGLHGAAIDGACNELLARTGMNIEDTMGAHDGMFDKVEGFIATFEDGVITVELIRQPAYLKTLATVCQ